MLIIGPAVTLRDELAWYEKLPLFAQRIVVTRPREHGLPASAVLEALGAEVLLAPTVEIRPLESPAPLDAAIDRLGEYDWLVFTSANGVRFFVERLAERGRDLRALGHLKLAAIGPTTAQALARFYLRADIVPESYRSESLADELGRIARKQKILLARADRGREILLEELRKLADVDQVPVYQNRDVGIAFRGGDRADSEWKRRLDHADELRHRHPIARLASGFGSRARRARRAACQLEPRHIRHSQPARLGGRCRGEGVHNGWTDPGAGGRGGSGEAIKGSKRKARVGLGTGTGRGFARTVARGVLPFDLDTGSRE